MTEEELLQISEVPTLNRVVQSGDEAIIQTTRLEQQVRRQLTDFAVRVSLPDAESDDEPPDAAEHIEQNPPYADPFPDEDELELMIDDVVDRHITLLRRDLRALLERALQR